MKVPIFLIAALIFASPALARQPHDGHAMPGAAAGVDKSPSGEAFRAANATMHKGIDIVFSGKADVNFVKGMIAHHQGAIDMAAVELKYGTDPAMRKLAEEIVKAQTDEIATMQDRLKKAGM